MNIGNIIQQERKRRKYSQSEFAAICKISVRYLSLIESGRMEPAIATLKVIAEKLQLPLPVLFFLSLDEKDIPEDKKEIYNILKPSIEATLSNIFAYDKIDDDSM